MLMVKETNIPHLDPQRECYMFFNHFACFSQGETVSAFIPTAVGLNCLLWHKQGDECSDSHMLQIGLLLEKMLNRLGSLYMMNNHNILECDNSDIFQMLVCHLSDQKQQ